MKIALVSPLFPDWENRREARAYYAFPAGIGYIAACLRRAGHTARIFIPDPGRMPMAQVWKELGEFKPDLVGITAVTANFMEAGRVAAEAKKKFGCLVIMGGAHVTALPRSTLESLPALDAVILGEGELPMLALAAEFDERGKADFASVPGAAFIKDGQYRQNPRPEPIADLDSLPYPAMDLLNGDFYQPGGNSPNAVKSAKIVTSRGCPGQCTFCANICMGRKFRAHSPQYVVGEMKHLMRTYGIRNFRIHDDCFTADPRRVAAICDLIMKEKLDVTWDAAGRVNTLLDEALVLKMKKAGCVRILLGIETGNQRINSLIGKMTTLETAERCCALLRRHGIHYFNSFLIGCEEETVSTAMDTMRFSGKLRATINVFSILTPFPGTPIFEKYYKDFDRPGTDWSRWATHGPSRLYETRHTRLSNSALWWLMVLAYLRCYLNPMQFLRIMDSGFKP